MKEMDETRRAMLEKNNMNVQAARKRQAEEDAANKLKAEKTADERMERHRTAKDCPMTTYGPREVKDALELQAIEQDKTLSRHILSILEAHLKASRVNSSQRMPQVPQEQEEPEMKWDDDGEDGEPPEGYDGSEGGTCR